MAVTKVWTVTHSLSKVLNYATNKNKTDASIYSDEQLQALKDVLDYAKNEEKTEKEFYVTGINCPAKFARDSFVLTKKRFGKTNGVQAYHGYMSFKRGEVTPEMAHKIGVEVAQKIWGDRFQVLVTTHLNSKCLHNHFVINSVSFKDGKKLAGEEKYWKKFHHLADEVCREHKLSIVENPQYKNHSYIRYEFEKKGIPMRIDLAKQALDEAIANSYSVKDLILYMNKLGYECQFKSNYKYWTVRPYNSQKSIRTYRLGENYTKDSIINRVLQNKSTTRFESLQEPVFQYDEKYESLKKQSGLYRMYLYYCYRLGYFDKSKKTNQQYNRLHPALREDLQNVERYSEQADMLCKYKIETIEELEKHKEDLLSQKERLMDDRKNLKNLIRRVGITEVEVDKAKEQISVINQELKRINREIDNCERVAQRSAQIEQNIELIDSVDNNYIEEKEVKDNERIR